MVGKMMEIGVKTVMRNNFYRFGGEVRLQGEGGGIGVKLTGDLAKGVMVGWDKLFKNKIERIVSKILFYKRYVDDQNVAIEVIKKGLRYNSEDQQMEEMIEEDHRGDDERTFETI